MLHAATDTVRILNDPVTSLALDVRNKADPAGVFFELGAIQPFADTKIFW